VAGVVARFDRGGRAGRWAGVLTLAGLPRLVDLGCEPRSRTLRRVEGRASFWDWFMGRTPKWMARMERMLAHPVRSSILVGTGCALVVVVLGRRSLGAALAWVIFGNLVLGPSYIWCCRKTFRNNTRRLESS
jgi:hypothetical protein